MLDRSPIHRNDNLKKRLFSKTFWYIYIGINCWHFSRLKTPGHFCSGINFLTFWGLLSLIFLRSIYDSLFPRLVFWHLWAYYLKFFFVPSQFSDNFRPTVWHLFSRVNFLTFLVPGQFFGIIGPPMWHFCSHETKISRIFQKFSVILTRKPFREYPKWRNEIFQVNV